MKHLIIHDEEGFIISTMGGTPEPREPIGVPFLWADVPIDQQVIKINVSVTPHEAVLVSLPKSEAQKAQEQIDALTQAVAELSLLVGGNA
ncbi:MULTISPECIES: hypothetical protein [unclassified Lysinibacillus]|uniref:hypothetical protein n=1 Tax=unclassified Lysinibacillus TaxID=2636778 RepID=UPI0008872904|nr:MULTISPECIES: hypothetical protein [unclassified Lysinibacillus]SCX93913.1 hypothetical protein SAMN02787078_00552 [Lysinibacillus sp. SG9]SDB07120.1 hypothetical protein SAMN02787079_00551 [Lysinibacillus sp. TC-37]SFS39082.1 hypothetical protein SAMN02787087_00556 [Lysinibacillus sp. SG55]